MTLGGKYGVHHFFHFDGKTIELESETGEIEPRRGGIFRGQQLPGGLGGQVKFARFVIAVAETAKAAEQVGEIDDRDGLDVVPPAGGW